MNGEYIILEVDLENAHIILEALHDRHVNFDQENKTDIEENGMREYMVITAYAMNHQQAFYLGLYYSYKLLSEDFYKKSELIVKMMEDK